ncbi:MAG: hypothetical protein NTV36_00250 [Candidatus Staskawiczbacteria bacterium]|nr:hypothetical protein [Candidatus Staskawiczbacteria bacterium]
MKKNISLVILLCLLAIIFVPALTRAGGLVPCDTNCGINDFFTMLVNIYTFIVQMIATPLAILAIIIGGILMMVSAGNPNLMGTGKKILYSAIIGLVLVFGSYLIINQILISIGVTGGLSTFTI